MYGSYKCTLRAARDYAARHFRIQIQSYRLEAMSNKPFIYQALSRWGKTIPNTIYSLPITLACRLRRRNHPESGTRSPDPAGQQAFHDASFMLRPAHQKQVGLFFTIQKPAKTTSTWRCNSKKLRNRRQRRAADLPGYRHRIIVGKKGQRVWTGGGDEEARRKASITPISKITCAIHRTRAGHV